MPMPPRLPAGRLRPLFSFAPVFVRALQRDGGELAIVGCIRDDNVLSVKSDFQIAVSLQI